MRVEELFPPCTRDDCSQFGATHHHVLPHQQELLDSTEKYIAQVGGYGSAKTLGACVMGHLLSVGVPGNLGIVCRASYPKLHDSTERIYLEVLNRSGVHYEEFEKRDGWPHRIRYSNGSEVSFRETKDLGRFLGPEYGWFFIDEAQEEPEKTFKDLSGRLRLPRAAGYLRGMLATNPPSEQHWIAKMFPKPGTWTREAKLKDAEVIIQTYRMIRSSTYENPFVNREYVAGLLINHTPAEAKRIVEGMYGFSSDGDPVYPLFDFFKHVADPATYLQTIYRGWDFGFHRPACAWAQIIRCRKGGLHLVVLEELGGEDQDAIPFATDVLSRSSAVFPSIPDGLFMDGGDAAGAAISDKGPGAIILLSRPVSEGGKGLQFRYRKFPNIDPGLDLVRYLLRSQCPCGKPLFTIHRRCANLIQALSGGYHYAAVKPGKEGKKKPVKDGFYDNYADTVRYLAELFYRPVMEGYDVLPDPTDGLTSSGSDPWAWMERAVVVN